MCRLTEIEFGNNQTHTLKHTHTHTGTATGTLVLYYGPISTHPINLTLKHAVLQLINNHVFSNAINSSILTSIDV